MLKAYRRFQFASFTVFYVTTEHSDKSTEHNDVVTLCVT